MAHRRLSDIDINAPQLDLPQRTRDVPSIVRATQGSIMPPPQQGLLARLFTDPSIMAVLAQLGGMAAGGGYGGMAAGESMQRQQEVARQQKLLAQQQAQIEFENTHKRDILDLERKRTDAEIKRLDQEQAEKRLKKLRDAVGDVREGKLTAEQAAETYELSTKDAMRLRDIKPKVFAVSRKTGEIKPEENVPRFTMPSMSWPTNPTGGTVTTKGMDIRDPDFTDAVPELLVGDQALGARSEGRMTPIQVPQEAQEFFGSPEITIPEGQRLEFAKFIRSLTPDVIHNLRAVEKAYGPFTEQQRLAFLNALPPVQQSGVMSSFDPQTGAWMFRQGPGAAEGGGFLDPVNARQSAQKFESSTQLIRMIDELTKVSKPSDLGAIGTFKQFVASTASQAAALGDKEFLPAFAESQPITKSLAETIVYKYARILDPSGPLDREVVNRVRSALGLGDYLSNLAAAKIALTKSVRPEAILQAQQSAKALGINWEPPATATSEVLNIEAITDTSELERISTDISQPLSVRQQAIERWKRLATGSK